MRYSKFAGNNSRKLGEWTIVCDYCGHPGYASEMIQQDFSTGKGGLIVHKFEADGVHWGMFPVVPRPEIVPQPQRGAFANGATNDPDAIDLSTTNPASITSTL